jgi:hypothetical protein
MSEFVKFEKSEVSQWMHPALGQTSSHLAVDAHSQSIHPVVVLRGAVVGNCLEAMQCTSAFISDQ